MTCSRAVMTVSRHSFPGYSFALPRPVEGGLMKNEYGNYAARQPHRDKGSEYKDSVVHFLVDGAHAGSGVLIGDGSCVLMTYHQVRDFNVTARPLNKRIEIFTGENYLTAPGEIIEVVDFVVHPGARSRGNKELT